LRRVGLEEIHGGLLLDDSYFAVSEPDPGAFDGQPYRTDDHPDSGGVPVCNPM